MLRMLDDGRPEALRALAGKICIELIRIQHPPSRMLRIRDDGRPEALRALAAPHKEKNSPMSELIGPVYFLYAGC